jgi:pimeloyl-ACP methyl ester carboxylesterase
MYQSDALRRRPSLGLVVEPRQEGAGLRVVGADEDAAAGRAGVRPGDSVLALDGRPIHDAAELVERTRAIDAGRPVAFRVRRGEETLELSAVAEPLRLERVDGAEVVLGDVAVHGKRLRTITTVPSAREARGVIVYLQGIAGGSIEHPFEPGHPLSRMVQGWTHGGFATVRVDRSGVGDSDGPHFRDTDFAAEVAMYDAVLASIDSPQVFLFGHSLGGMVAPLVARTRDVTGVIVFGTSCKGWHECMVDTRRRQRRLAGRYADDEMDRWTELHALVCAGSTPEEVFARRPDLRPLESSDCRGAHLFGRHATFFHQLAQADVAGAWRSLGADVLVLHGEHDWICSREEAEAIAREVNAAHPERALHVELPRIGHDGLAHAGLERSFAHPEDGTWDGRVVETTLGWMNAG